MRLIDADALEKVVEIKEYDVINRDWGESDGFSGAAVFNMIADSPTIDPVKHGHWIWSKAIGDKCSVCGFMCGSHDDDNADNYCSHCGAKMDEKAD